jgi:hypothetical protein
VFGLITLPAASAIVVEFKRRPGTRLELAARKVFLWGLDLNPKGVVPLSENSLFYLEDQGLLF